MKKLYEAMLYYLYRLGNVGAVGVILLGAALFLEFAKVQPMLAEFAELAASNEQVRMAQVIESRETDETQVQDVMPVSPAAEAALRQLFMAADKAGLDLEQGEYKLVEDTGTNRRRYTLTLPVIGSYPAIHSFIARSLNDDHALALNSIEMRRETIEDSELDALLSFTLYLGAES